jgi:hypothetical protein
MWRDFRSSKSNMQEVAGLYVVSVFIISGYNLFILFRSESL